MDKIDQSELERAKIFKEDHVWRMEDAREPCVVYKGEDVLELSEDEKNLLKQGPKFSVMGRLNEEQFEVELEQSLMKVKGDMLASEKEAKNKSDSDIAIEFVIDEEQKEECEEHERMLDAKCRMVYDWEKNTFDFSKRRTTDLKNNSRVIFPKSRDFQFEAKLELLRIEAMEVFKQYMRDKCDKYGGQKTNLNKSEARGLKSLKKRTKEGVLVVLPTDKTGNFAVMDRASYEEAGLSHVKEDKEVGWYG